MALEGFVLDARWQVSNQMHGARHCAEVDGSRHEAHSLHQANRGIDPIEKPKLSAAVKSDTDVQYARTPIEVPRLLEATRVIEYVKLPRCREPLVHRGIEKVLPILPEVVRAQCPKRAGCLRAKLRQGRIFFSP